ncbi:unnamed protein product [Rotaria sp. Silwood2]|nr:unnamed protein product [Rotaria sp. Silwood2]
MGKSSLVSSSQPRSIAVGDFNNDNLIDIVVANSGSNTIDIFLSRDNGTFMDQNIHTAGSQSSPYSVVTNDFNSDSFIDIAVANYRTNNVGMFFGYGNGTISTQTPFSTGSSHPFFIKTGDFNNDNRSDIVIANHGTNSIGVYLGRGDGSFQTEKRFFTGYDSVPYSIDVNDFNNDNNLDIVVANYGTNNIGIFLGRGNGDFESQMTYSTNMNSNPTSVAVGDFNNDNHLDIVVANNGTGNLGIFFGFGNGTFAKQTIYSLGSNSYPQYVAVGDFNGDQELDIAIVTSNNDQIQIILGSGNGTFFILATYDEMPNSHSFSIVIADFNKDNQSDIAVSNYGTNNVLVMSGYFTELLTRQTTYIVNIDSRLTCIATADFDNDGYLDIVVNGIAYDSLLLLAGTSNGTFARKKIFSAGYQSQPNEFCICDVNNDNQLDIITANMGSDSVGVILGDANQIFRNVTTYSTGIHSSPASVAVGDVNNDTNLDIISANSHTSSVSVLLGYGDGNFAIAVMYSVGIGNDPSSLALGDVNNDGYLDIAITNYFACSLSILYGDGYGVFRLMIFSTGYNSGPRSITLVDLNDDSYLDIVVANNGASDIGIFLGHGDGSFSVTAMYSTGIHSQPYKLVVADYNHDNHLDIVATLFTSSEVVIYFGYGNGSFQLARRYTTGYNSGPCDIVLANLNNDKQLEIIVVLYSKGSIGMLTPYTAANFKNQAFYSTGSAPMPYSIAITDFNNDNQSNIVIANSGTDNLRIGFDFYNGTFQSQTIYSTGFRSHPEYVTVGDVNNDNYQDIIIIDSYHTSISMIMGCGNGSFNQQQITFPVNSGSNPSAIIVSDFNNDNRSDLFIVNEGTDSIATLNGYNYSTFNSPDMYKTAIDLGPVIVVTADFNNDNCLDLAAPFMASGSIGILLGYGNGSFSTIMTYQLGTNASPGGLDVGDLNNDGKIDIAIADYGTNNVIILIGYGNGSFASMMYFSAGNNSQPLSIVMADFNRDNRLDIAVANSGSDSVGVFLGYGNGSFATIMAYSTGYNSFPVMLITYDLNRDNHTDIIAVNRKASTIGIFLGYGNGSFRNQAAYANEQSAVSYSAAVIAFDNNSDPDIIVTNENSNSLAIFYNYRNGTFSSRYTVQDITGSLPIYVTVGDMNNDSKLDIILVNYGTNNVNIYFGYKSGIYNGGRPYSTGVGSGPIWLAIADFNNDNRSDFAIANCDTSEIGVFIKISTSFVLEHPTTMSTHPS